MPNVASTTGTARANAPAIPDSWPGPSRETITPALREQPGAWPKTTEEFDDGRV